MPENSKKNQHKNKNEPKEQRRPRQRQKNQTVETINEKRNEVPSKSIENPDLQEPGPEFYKNLKRETDEILKITEEANNKYKKKEIQSNWKKYETPVATYEDIEEQENMGEDYEKLIQVPLTTGSHFKFRHEKLWDTESAPTEYDKYFEIEPESLAFALLSIPFYERNNLDISQFDENEMKNMQNRAAKFKERYENEQISISKEHTDNIESIAKDNIAINRGNIIEEHINVHKKTIEFQEYPITLQTSHTSSPITDIRQKMVQLSAIKDKVSVKEISDGTTEDITAVEIKNAEEATQEITEQQKNTEMLEKLSEIPITLEGIETVESVSENKPKVLESPEDLEKWLDEFLEN